MKLAGSVLAAALLAPGVSALIGYGTRMYEPACAHSCGRAIEPAPLSCSMEGHHGGMHSHGGPVMTTPACRSSDSSFLTTLAWCMNERCRVFHVEAWSLEKYWVDQATGDPNIPPKWTYAQALDAATRPVSVLDVEQTINGTMNLQYQVWDDQLRTLKEFEHQETLHARYGLVLLIIGFGLPVVLTSLGYLPFMSGIIDRLKPSLVYPSSVGTYHIRPLPYLLGNAPTVGQAIYVAIFFVLNLVLSAVGYRSVASVWFESSYQEILGYVSNRTGVLAFALAPLVILFSSRNNILLWCTNWSHSTYMLVHRWVARIFGIQVIIHSIGYLVLYKDQGILAASEKDPFWIWGIIATLAVCIMLVASILYMRRWSYEVFLIVHIILAVFVIVGSWYHVELRFRRAWGYEQWLYAACAVWFFDRVMRVLRIAKVGIRRAKVTDIGTAFVRVDIEGVRWSPEPGYHAYAYFPTLKPLTPWENHPFSVIAMQMLRRSRQDLATDSEIVSGNVSSEEGDVEKNSSAVTNARPIRATGPASMAGVSLYIRKSGGWTAGLQAQDNLTTLLDGPYSSNATKDVLRCERLLVIAGGIGITGALPFTIAHLNVRLCWSVKDYAECLVHELDPAMTTLAEKDIRVGRRFDLHKLISQEAETASESGHTVKVGVVVCGPASMCDDVRAIVARAGRHQKSSVVFELEVHAFSW